jgi:hypothetical protein
MNAFWGALAGVAAAGVQRLRGADGADRKAGR